MVFNGFVCHSTQELGLTLTKRARLSLWFPYLYAEVNETFKNTRARAEKCSLCARSAKRGGSALGLGGSTCLPGGAPGMWQTTHTG